MSRNQQRGEEPRACRNSERNATRIRALSEVDRYLALLRRKMLERGYTQLDVEHSLRWGRSYVSQLLSKEKCLRVEQVLLILGAIGVEPRDYFRQLYPRAEEPKEVTRGASVDPGDRTLTELGDVVRALAELLLDKSLVSLVELTSVVHDEDATEPAGLDRRFGRADLRSREDFEVTGCQ